MRIRVIDGFIDETVPKHLFLDMSGFTGTCDDKEYEDSNLDDLIMVKWDDEVIKMMPYDYIAYCEDVLDEDVTRYAFYKSDLVVV